MSRPAAAGSPPAAPHAEARLALGALVLGALDPAERTAVEAHVSTCPACTSDLAEFAAIPGLLGRLSLDQVQAIAAGPAEPPSDLLDRVLAEAASRRTNQRRAIRWTAAAVAVAAGIAWFVVAGPLAGTEREPVVVVDARDEVSDVWGEITLSPTPNGTQVALALTGVRPGEDCELVAWTADGRKEVASTWQATYQGKAMVTGSTSLPLADIAGLTIKTPDGRKLLSLAVPG